MHRGRLTDKGTTTLRFRTTRASVASAAHEHGGASIDKQWKAGGDARKTLLKTQRLRPLDGQAPVSSNVPAGHINIHGHQHRALKPAGSPHVNVSVEQLDYRPVSLVRLRRFAGALVAGGRPAGETTLERIEAIEG